MSSLLVSASLTSTEAWCGVLSAGGGICGRENYPCSVIFVIYLYTGSTSYWFMALICLINPYIACFTCICSLRMDFLWKFTPVKNKPFWNFCLIIFECLNKHYLKIFWIYTGIFGSFPHGHPTADERTSLHQTMGCTHQLRNTPSPAPPSFNHCSVGWPCAGCCLSKWLVCHADGHQLHHSCSHAGDCTATHCHILKARKIW